MEGSTLEVPVLVVGGGPVGLSMCVGLRRFGIDCLLVEKHDSTLDFPKGRAIHARTMEIFRQWDLERPLCQVGLPAEEVSFAFLGETLLSSEFRQLSFVEPRMTAASPCARLICSQELMEPVLRDAAVDAGADLRFGHELQSFEQDDSGVSATIVRRADGHALNVRCQFLIAADGGHSTCRDLLGVQVSGPGAVGNSVSILVDAPLRDRIADRASVLYGVSTPRPGAGFAVVDNDRRWLLMLPRDLDNEPPSAFTEEYCRSLVTAAIGDSDVPVTYLGHRIWQPTACWADAMSTGRVHLVGDAAHLTTPAGGLGMNTGVADAHNLVWKLAGVLDGWAPEELLATYNQERRPIAQLTAEASIAIGLSMRDPDARRGAYGVMFGSRYESDAITSDDTKPPSGENAIHDYVPSGCPGGRAPHVVGPGGGSVLDEFGTEFCVLFDENHAHDIDASETGAPIRVVAMQDPTWREAYGVTERGVVIVRPDGFISFRDPDCSGPVRVLGTYTI